MGTERRLLHRNAVVTGAGRGIGRAIALALATEGANIVACDLGGEIDGTGSSTEPAETAVEECLKLGVNAVAHYGDVSDFAVAEDIIGTCVECFGRIDILCNLAGIDRSRMIFNMSEEEWDRVLAVHLKGTFNMCRHASALMREQRYGRILNCASDAMVGAIGMANYAAAKAGIAGLTYAIAWEMGKYGVTCNAITPAGQTRMAPGPSVAEAFRRRVENGLWTEEMYEMALNRPPPETMSMIAAYLCSDSAADINGCIFGAVGHRLSYWSPPAEAAVISRDWQKEGPWTWEEVERHMPGLLEGYVNPASLT